MVFFSTQIIQGRGSPCHSILDSFHGEGFTFPAQTRKVMLAVFRPIGTTYWTC